MIFLCCHRRKGRLFSSLKKTQKTLNCFCYLAYLLLLFIVLTFSGDWHWIVEGSLVKLFHWSFVEQVCVEMNDHRCSHWFIVSYGISILFQPYFSPQDSSHARQSNPWVVLSSGSLLLKEIWNLTPPWTHQSSFIKLSSRIPVQAWTKALPSKLLSFFPF